MSERLDALRRWLQRPERTSVEVTLDEESAVRLKNLAGGRSDPEVLSFLASHMVEDVLKAEDWDKRVNDHAEAPSVGDPAPDAEVFSAGGERVALSTAWRGGRVALVFLRHYG